MSVLSKRAALATVLAAAVAWGTSLFVLVRPSEAQPPDASNPRAKAPARPTSNQANSRNQPKSVNQTKSGKAAPSKEEAWLITKDGVQLYVEYRKPARAKGAKNDDNNDLPVPVVLLHMAKGSGRDWRPLAETLQRAGHAVIVPDLRGHGKSTQFKRGTRTGRIDQATMRREDYERMVTIDMELIKKFVIEKNNAGELNLRKLCVIGAEMGAAVAVNWAALDWSWPPLATGPQGQDVNGLVLLTPLWGYKGMSIVNATKHAAVQQAISTLIIIGSQDNANLNDAKRLHQTLAKYREDFTSAPKEEWEQRQSIFLHTPKTSLEGTKMLGEKTLGVEPAILDFIRMRLVNRPAEWSVRKRPLE
jgi:alpha-beta hydrolase superfamily lysophospholipase